MVAIIAAALAAAAVVAAEAAVDATIAVDAPEAIVRVLGAIFRTRNMLRIVRMSLSRKFPAARPRAASFRFYCRAKHSRASRTRRSLRMLRPPR